MTEPVTINERARAVLYAVVTEFIATGEPVGSRTLSSHYGLALSPATIRHVLKDLEEDGFLSQPHTSAGRVPTRWAYQVFIDALMQVGNLAPEDEERIRGLFDGQLERSSLLRDTGRLLSDLAGVPSVVLQARSESRAVTKVRFIPTRPGEILSVIVLDDGSVENRFIATDAHFSGAQLERVHALLDEATEGRTLRALKNHLQEVADAERNEIGALTQLSERLLTLALHRVDQSREVIIQGRSNLFESAGDPERIKRLMVALDDREQLVGLLQRTLASEQVQVFLGEESGRESESPLSLVAAPFQGQGAVTEGALGVLGPNRMNYPQLVPLVGAVAQAMSSALADRENPPPDE